MSIEPKAEKLDVSQARDIASFYNVPLSLVNLYFITIGGRLFPMEPFLIAVASRRGFQRIEVIPTQEKDGSWSAQAHIYPKIPDAVLNVLPSLDPIDRKKLLDYHTAPTSDSGRASKENVRMSTMHQWLKEIAVKRAVTRACRKFAGVDMTAYEELPDVDVKTAPHVIEIPQDPAGRQDPPPRGDV